MKRLFVAMLALMLLCGCSQTKEYASHMDKIRADGKVVIATEGMWEPWTYVDENGDLTGYDVELGKKIAEKLGVEAEFVTGDFTGFLSGLDNGQYDLVINGIDVTDERKEKYDFSETYAYAVSYLIVKGDNEDIKSLEDLNGKKLTNSLGSSYANLGESYGATNVGGDTFADTINNILNGYADASINSADTYGLYIKEHPDADVKVVATIDPLDVAIPFVKGEYNDSFREAVNEVIREMKASGELSALSVQFFGTDITVK
ncbi:MAG: transporter substrate-binding domain-containing protein [Erysipelotrichaceae bacterium]|nr:transporter substrate-binding domain-containing protein [Erysipelotrichaceae bacterium]